MLAANVLAAGWGGTCWLRGIASVSFWPILRAAQAAVVLEVLAGVVVYAQGARPPDELHYVYGLSPLFVSVFAEAARAGAAGAETRRVDDVEALERREQILLARRVVVREIGIMTVGSLLIVTLSLRAVSSGGLF